MNLIELQKIGPQWLVYNLAALYWRIVGVPSEAVTCLRAALQIQVRIFFDEIFFVAVQFDLETSGVLPDIMAVIYNLDVFSLKIPE